MTDYAGDPTSLPTSIPLLSDATPPTAAELNVPLEALADRTAYLSDHLLAVPALTFQSSITTSPNDLQVLKYSDALMRWFAVGTTADQFFTTKQLTVWPTTTEIPTPLLLGNASFDFDVDSAGNVLTIDQGIDNIRKRTAAGVWTQQASDGDNTSEPNILWEPVSGNWITAFTNGVAIKVRTSSNLWSTRTDRTAPSGMPGTARVTLGHNGLGRVVMQGFSGTNTYFSYSDNGGVTWSAVTTFALGFTYTHTSLRHHPKPVFNGKRWVAVAMDVTNVKTKVFTSADGVTWAAGSSFTSVAIESIVGLGGVLLGCATNTSSSITHGSLVYSVDHGVTWRRGEGAYNAFTTSPTNLARTGSRFIVLGASKIFPGIGFLTVGGAVT